MARVIEGMRRSEIAYLFCLSVLITVVSTPLVGEFMIQEPRFRIKSGMTEKEYYSSYCSICFTSSTSSTICLSDLFLS